MTAPRSSTPLEQQLDYYRARAAEYDQWWHRQGRYDRGAALNAQWFADAAAVSVALTERLRELGWQFTIRQTEHYFIYGSGNG